MNGNASTQVRVNDNVLKPLEITDRYLASSVVHLLGTSIKYKIPATRKIRGRLMAT